MIKRRGPEMIQVSRQVDVSYYTLR